MSNGRCCNPEGALLDETTAMPSSDVPPELQCQRPGCRKRWPSPDND
ncbi:MAG TPA: hypothetical protein VNP72_09650 [Longimicrobium sp.]|nr:hypothetical protein [Longimicrobium sp.]